MAPSPGGEGLSVLGQLETDMMRSFGLRPGMKKFSKLLNPCRKQLCFLRAEQLLFSGRSERRGVAWSWPEREVGLAGDPSSGPLWNF